MKLFLCAVSLLCVGSLFAAGTVAETRESNDELVQRITLSWTADTNGAVAVTSQPVRGEMSRVVFYNGTAAPTGATYGVTLKDVNGIDVLAGQGSAVASNALASASQIVPGILKVWTLGSTNLEPIVVNGKLSLAVTGVGSNQQGVVVIYTK
jgi:hypothetical protein